ncbi:MAG TPA: cupin-like domain-containing protein [Burkholderiaceae bacterium]
MPRAVSFANHPVRELDCTGSQQLSADILTATEPLILRGLVASWPMVRAALTSQQAADAYLRRFYQDATVTVMHGPPDIAGRFFYNDDLSGFNYTSSRVKLDVVLDALRDHGHDDKPPAIYVGSSAIDNYLPGFRAENDLDLPGVRDPLVNIWMGNRTRIPAHFDLPDNLACVAAGRRRFTLFPPEQLGNLYIGPLEFTPAGQAISLVDFAHPDLDKFPKFATAMAHARVAELETGDALFLPSMWWHHVEALDRFNVLVNYWWRQSPGYMDTPLNTLMHAQLTMRELPPAQRRAWQELFRHYVFESDGEETRHIPPNARGILAPFDSDAARVLRASLLNKMKR